MNSSSSLAPWHWRVLPLADRSASTVFARLFGAEPQATLLESPHPSPQPELCRFSLCAGSPRRSSAGLQVWTPKLGGILPTLTRLLTSGGHCDPLVAHLPFTGGWLGWLGYDLAREIERLPPRPDPLPFPIAYWYTPENFAVIDHTQGQIWLAVSDPRVGDRLEQQLDCPVPETRMGGDPSRNLTLVTDQAAYEAAVRSVKQHIHAGDIFQANLSLRFQSTTAQSGWQLYRRLQRINPSPFASYWRTPWGEVISCSPERLVQVGDRQVQTRPIAGTRRRGRDEQEDHQLAQELMNHPKERAEHIMLVDLERNDLGRVCRWGSVQVDELLTIERYSHVMHLVSNVRGELDRQYQPIDVIRALFPGGTITGCPKVRCMEIIAQLEPHSRSLFYGSCGYLDQRGHLDLNILIRTLLYQCDPQGQHRVWGQVGAGIVADSDPQREWQESLQKAKAQWLALTNLDEL